MSYKRLTLGGECPICGCVMGLEEVDINSCGACGYPDNDEDFDDNNFIDDDDSDDQDPNDSRNI